MRALAAAMLVFTFAPAGPPAPPAAQAECVRLSGNQIGQLPLVIEVADQRVEFLEWKATDITADELIGFTAQAPEKVRFTVEAGESTFPAGPNWLHPAGVVGPSVKPIRSLTLCVS